MTFSLPRISVSIDDANNEPQGFLGTLAIGLGLHLAWMLSIWLGGYQTAPAESISSILGSAPLLPTISMAVFAAYCLFAALTDQKLLGFYTSKKSLLALGLFMIVGSLFYLVGYSAENPRFFLFLSGVLTGIGSAGVILFWGIAYSRHDQATIVINTAVAVVIAALLVFLANGSLPLYASQVSIVIMPILELPILWKLTPVSYTIRHAVPIFTPLPVRKLPFCLLMGIPAILFGFVLGAFRTAVIQDIACSPDLATKLLSLFVGGGIAIVVILVSFAVDKRSHWDSLFRPAIPFIALCIFFIPMTGTEVSMLSGVMVLAGLLCFEALMWVFFSELAQEFRISPIFLFGIGQFYLALGLLGSLTAASSLPHIALLSKFGTGTMSLLLMTSLLVAHALLPRVRDIKREVAPTVVQWRKDMLEYNKSWVQEAAEEIGSQSEAIPHDLIAEIPEDEPKEQIALESETTESAADAAPNEDDKPRTGRFRAQCEDIADKHLLSRRETEVMFLLARGHNAAYIQEKLCISRSTAKTHISHIYSKLDIHSQQELLAMVDEQLANE